MKLRITIKEVLDLCNTFLYIFLAYNGTRMLFFFLTSLIGLPYNNETVKLKNMSWYLFMISMRVYMKNSNLVLYLRKADDLNI